MWMVIFFFFLISWVQPIVKLPYTRFLFALKSKLEFTLQGSCVKYSMPDFHRDCLPLPSLPHLYHPIQFHPPDLVMSLWLSDLSSLLLRDYTGLLLGNPMARFQVLASMKKIPEMATVSCDFFAPCLHSLSWWERILRREIGHLLVDAYRLQCLFFVRPLFSPQSYTKSD